MENFEQQPLLRNQEVKHEKIKNLRFQKELEFLSKSSLKYVLVNHNKVVIKEVLPHDLTIIVPSNYPFQQPTYEYLQSVEPVSKLIQFWVPKYKILEMVEFIAIKIQQKNKKEQIMKDYPIYHVFQKVGSLQMIILIAVLLRILVALGSHSGKNDWPNLGDFQAHRNWMSITVNKPIQDWYYQVGTTIWWRIDYPPIAAYLSYLFGLIYMQIQPKAMNLQMGYQSIDLTTYMRLTTLAVQLIFLFPPVILLTYKSKQIYAKIFLLTILVKPDIILIDHGHFQYNSLILGLILLGFYFLLEKRFYLTCISFTIALHAKQMAFYYAFAFFAGLIGSTYSNFRTNKVKIIGELIKYGVIVISVSLIIWLPWILTGTAHLVLQAIFPIHRGLYQLKVQNFWCISDVIIKWQTKFSKNMLMVICFFISTLFSVPSILGMIVSPSKKVLSLGFFSISMTFFLFSYHVHEKSILLPLLMAPFLTRYIGANLVKHLVIAGCVGMYHLLKEDGQAIQYFAMMTLYIIAMEAFSNFNWALKQFQSQPQRQKMKIQKMNETIYENNKLLDGLFYCTLIGLHLVQLTINPPQKFPYLFNLLFAFFSFALNLYSLLIVNMIIAEESMKKMREIKSE